MAARVAPATRPPVVLRPGASATPAGPAPHASATVALGFTAKNKLKGGFLYIFLVFWANFFSQFYFAIKNGEFCTLQPASVA